MSLRAENSAKWKMALRACNHGMAWHELTRLVNSLIDAGLDLKKNSRKFTDNFTKIFQEFFHGFRREKVFPKVNEKFRISELPKNSQTIPREFADKNFILVSIRLVKLRSIQSHIGHRKGVLDLN